jgi:hypothetical protein
MYFFFLLNCILVIMVTYCDKDFEWKQKSYEKEQTTPSDKIFSSDW